MSQRVCRGIFSQSLDIKTVDISGNHANILKWECEMLSLPRVRITTTAPLMNTSRTGLRKSCGCIHKHFFRTHTNPWALFWSHKNNTHPCFARVLTMAEKGKIEHLGAVVRLRDEHQKVMSPVLLPNWRLSCTLANAQTSTRWTDTALCTTGGPTKVLFFHVIYTLALISLTHVSQ